MLLSRIARNVRPRVTALSPLPKFNYSVRTIYKSARFRRERSQMWRGELSREGSNGTNGQQNLFTKLLDRYVRQLDTNPLTTKAVTSMFIVGVGDIGCQMILGEKDAKFDMKRFLIFTFLGGALVGPTLHYWYGFLNRAIPGTGTKPALKRLAVDQTIFAASFIPIFMGSALTLEGKFKDIPSVLSREWFPALLANWSIWIPGNFITFRFITPKFQVLFANTVALGWNTYLSWASHRDEGPQDGLIDNERVHALFDEFDSDGNGKIDQHEFQDLAFSLGVVLSESEADLVIKKVDQDGDGMIDLREFQIWLHGDNGDGNESDTSSLNAMLLKAKLNARVALKSISEIAASNKKTKTTRKIKESKIVHVYEGDLHNVPTHVIHLEIEERLEGKKK
jgi:hypothetical protein